MQADELSKWLRKALGSGYRFYYDDKRTELLLVDEIMVLVSQKHDVFVQPPKRPLDIKLFDSKGVDYIG